MSTLKNISLWLLAAFYVFAGINHFVNPAFYVAIMPTYLPAHLPLVYLSGLAEVALGAAVLFPGTRKLAAWGIILLLVAVFPANLHQAVNDVPVGGESLGASRWVRLPFQAVFMAWAWWHTRD